MKIAVIGAKVIGGTLASKWVKAGHTIKFGVRNTENPDLHALLRKIGGGASAGTVRDAIRFGDVVVFAIPGGAMEETLKSSGGDLNGKVVIDATNRVGGPVLNSLAAITLYAPGAPAYRAFNTLGWENFENPQFGDQTADLFYCGPDGESRPAVETLIRDVGLRPVYIGTREQVHVVDALTGLWFALAFGRKMGRNLAFKMLTR